MKKAVFIVLMLAVMCLFAVPTQAAGTLTLTVSATSEEAAVGDEVAFTVSMSDARDTDFAAFSFSIKLPDGLKLKPGSGKMAADFKSTTGMAMTAFDETPKLMVSGFGDKAYNGGSVYVAAFVCTVEAVGTHKVELSDVKLLNVNVKSIPTTVVPVVVTVKGTDGEALPNDNSAGSDNNDTGNNDTGSSNSNDNTGSKNTGSGSKSGGTASEETNSNKSAPIPVEWVNPFSDVKRTDWFYDYVSAVQASGIMNGTSKTAFSPNTSVTRAMFARILANLDGADLSGYKASRFSDVPTGQWYSAAVEWAADKSIVAGVGGGRFDTNANITREQMAVMLWNYAKYAGIDVSVGEDTNILSYNDAFGVSEYAIPAMQWVCGAGVVSGKPGGLLDPKGKATRAEVAAVLTRFIENAANNPLFVRKF